MAKAKRSSRAKAVKEFANKGYCASKGFWYYSVKVHVLGIRCTGTLPLADFIGLTPAGNHDLNAFRQIVPYIKNCNVYADLAYMDELEKQYFKENNSEIHTPVKKKKGQKYLELFDQLLSTGVSKVRQPVESLFNWIQEKRTLRLFQKYALITG